jgi:hypothetical protein
MHFCDILSTSKKIQIKVVEHLNEYMRVISGEKLIRETYRLLSGW